MTPRQWESTKTKSSIFMGPIFCLKSDKKIKEDYLSHWLELILISILKKLIILIQILLVLPKDY